MTCDISLDYGLGVDDGREEEEEFDWWSAVESVDVISLPCDCLRIDSYDNIIAAKVDADRIVEL